MHLTHGRYLKPIETFNRHFNDYCEFLQLFGVSDFGQSKINRTYMIPLEIYNNIIVYQCKMRGNLSWNPPGGF